MVYKLKNGARLFGAYDAQLIGDELMKINETYGELTPELIVQEAASPSHPLHDQFEWNDTEAAKKWRVRQAQNLCQVIVTIVGPNESEVRAVYNVKITENHTRRSIYAPLAQVLSDDGLFEQVMGDILNGIAHLRKKMEDLRQAGLAASTGNLAALLQQAEDEVNGLLNLDEEDEDDNGGAPPLM